MNIIFDVTYLISGIYTKFTHLSMQKVLHRISVINRDVNKLVITGYCL